ncbi:hypothetical protein H7J50_19810 [Mycobacterium intermedium]|uniref:hypothetical protein n=1 Tax=Mycobacterium intermedium TaxID=28445 RepID=UPI00111C88F7|nr:hypothetical protein [Mycobacterium intermedium]MCV6966037.1 hypothetical protein [Mycobacterium intermedium]
MSGDGYPKFAWMARVAEDSRLSDAQARILIYIANQYVRGRDVLFCVRQSTVADKLHKRRQTVGDALRRGRELDYLKLASKRPRGRGWHQADTHQLAFPEIRTPRGTSSKKEVRGDEKMGARTGPEYVRREAELGTSNTYPNNRLPAERQTLQGVHTGLNGTGSKEQGASIVPGSSPDSPFAGLFFRDQQRPREQRKALPISQNVIDADVVADPDAPRCSRPDCDQPAVPDSPGSLCGRHWAMSLGRRDG